MRTENGLQLVLQEKLYTIVVNARPEYRPAPPANVIDGYRYTVRITRTDGENVSGNFRNYNIPEGSICPDLKSAYREGTDAAHRAIKNGFPDD